MNKIIFALVSLLLTCGVYADLTTWTQHRGSVGSETFQVRFPQEPSTKPSQKQLMLYAHDAKNALYVVTTSNSPLAGKHASDAFAKIQQALNDGAKKVDSVRYLQNEGHPAMDVETINTKTGVKTRSRYIITPQNVWKVMTVYSDESVQRHDEFVASFQLTK